MRVGPLGIPELVILLIILAALFLIIRFLIIGTIRKIRSDSIIETETTQPSPTIGTHCGKCGAALASEDAFCTNCGVER